MHVNAINNNQLNFTSVVRLGNRKEYSAQQNKAAEEIELLLKRPMCILNNKTAESFYNSKGYDFGIAPYYDGKRVSIIGYKEVKNLSANVEPEDIKAKSRFIIGSFDGADKTFNILNLMNKIAEENQKESANVGVKVLHTIFAVLAVVTLMPVLYALTHSKLPAEQVKLQMENINKTAISDSVKAANEFIEVIKNGK